MANTTVYPFGTNGTMPSSIGVVNDLETGGADKAASAETVKTLNLSKVGYEEGEQFTTIVNLYDAHFNCYLSASNNRYFCAYSIPIKKGIKVKVENVPQSYNFGIGSRGSWADALNAGGVLPLETTDWETSTAEYTFTNDASLYLVIPFKRSDNGNLSSADVGAIVGATKVTIYDNEKILTIDGRTINPVTDASMVKYGSSSVGDALDAMKGIEFSSYVVYQSGGTTTRVAAIAEIPQGLIDIQCDLTLPSGIRFATKTIPDIANAFHNLYESGGVYFYDSGWVMSGKYHATIFNEQHNVLALVFSKTNNSNISINDIQELINYFKVDVVCMPVRTSFNKNGALVVAHRGTHYFNIPENSLDAFDLAGKLGYDYIEADIRRTSDGKYVVMHDTSINRTCTNADGTTISGTVNVASTTYDALRTNYRLKSSNPDYRKPIPSLEEYLYVVKKNGRKASAELLTSTNAQAKEVYDICKEIMGDGNFIHSSVYYEQLDYIRSIDPNILLCYGTTQIMDTTSAVDGSSRNNPRNEQQTDYTGQQYFSITKELVRSYHSKGMMFGAWTIPSEDYQFAIDRGLDIIVTNDIAPNIQNASAVEQIFDRTHRNGFVTDGTLSADGLTLTNGQKITFDSFSFERGILMLEVVASGDFTITTATKKLVSSGGGNTYSALSKSVSSEDLVQTNISSLYACCLMENSMNLQVTPTITASTNGAFIQSVKIYNVKI